MVQENNPHNASAAFGHVITQWLKMNYEYNKFGKPSWRMLVEGVREVDLERAKIIADKHKMVMVIYTYSLVSAFDSLSSINSVI